MTRFHTATFTHKRFYTQRRLFRRTHLHRDAFTQTQLPTATFTQRCISDRRFYTQVLFTEAFTHRQFYTDAFTHRRFSQKPLHTQRPLHTETFAHSCLCTDASGLNLSWRLSLQTGAENAPHLILITPSGLNLLLVADLTPDMQWKHHSTYTHSSLSGLNFFGAFRCKCAMKTPLISSW